MIYQKKIKKVQVTRSLTILLGFIDPDTTLDDEGLQKLKADHAVTVHLTVKKSLKDVHKKLRSSGWNMGRSSFSGEFDYDKPAYWSMTKIAGPKKNSGVTMHTTVNTNPSTIPDVPNQNFSFDSDSAFDQENEPYLPAFKAPEPLPKDMKWCSTIHTSNLPEQIDSGWEWAFNPPNRK